MSAVLAPAAVDLDAILGADWRDPWWRLNNLYWIVNKAGKPERFVPNDEQREFYENNWYRNLILKVRQLGFSTFEILLKLDQALFNGNFDGVVISDTRENAGLLFAKLEFAYDRLPEALKEALPLKSRESRSMLEFEHGSRVRVGTSARGGTVQDLHVSEMGEIASKRPAIAAEIVSGAFESVPLPDPATNEAGGRITVEATAKGADGEFYDLVMAALKRQLEGTPETPLDFRLHFFAWMGRREYRMDPATVLVSPDKHRYFDALQAKLGMTIDPWERAWYVKKEETLKRKMKQEYPSTPQEAFEVAIEGAIYGDEMTFVREKGRICDIPLDPGHPVNTFWDLGTNNYTAIWLHQQIGFQNRFLRYYQNAGRGLGFYKQWLADWLAAQGTPSQPVRWGTHYVPHDADAAMLGEDTRTKRTILGEGVNALKNIVVVPAISDLTVGIDLTRAALVKDCYFDKKGCDADGVVDDSQRAEKTGVKALDAYRYEWDANNGRYKDSPLKNWATDGADAFRQFAQVLKPAGPTRERDHRRRNRNPKVL